MPSHSTLRRELTFLIFTEVYQKFDDPKARRKAFSILEAAINCFARKGFDGTTQEMIAREAGVTRPLLRHYFEDPANLQEIAIKYIRLIFQKMAIDAMSSGKTADEMVLNYVNGCFEWIRNFRSHSTVWARFLSSCMSNKKFRALNTVAVAAGEERIQSLLEMGKSAGVFQFEDAAGAAKSLQVIISGALITAASEDLPDGQAFQKMIQKSVVHLLGIRPPGSI
jgi:AcrR family transcriptional regulator